MSQSPRGYGSAQQLAGQVSDLKIELARRDAEVEYLEGQLAEAVAANRPHVKAPTDHSSSQVLICCATRLCDIISACISRVSLAKRIFSVRCYVRKAVYLHCNMLKSVQNRG